MKPNDLTLRWSLRQIAFVDIFLQAGTTRLNRAIAFGKLAELALAREDKVIDSKIFNQKLYRLRKAQLISLHDDGDIELSAYFIEQYQSYLKQKGKAVNQAVLMSYKVPNKQLTIRASFVSCGHRCYATIHIKKLLLIAGDKGKASSAVGIVGGAFCFYTIHAPFILKSLQRSLPNFYLIGGRYLVNYDAIESSVLRKVITPTEQIHYFIDLPWGKTIELSYRQHHSLRSIQLGLQANQQQLKQPLKKEAA